MVRNGVTAHVENNCEISVRFPLRDPKRNFSLAPGEAQSFKPLDVFTERLLFGRRHVIRHVQHRIHWSNPARVTGALFPMFARECQPDNSSFGHESPLTSRAIGRRNWTKFLKILPLPFQNGKIGLLKMSIASTEEVTRILLEWNRGDRDAPARLMPLLYEELRLRAAEYLRHERPDHTLQATALVHETYLKLVDQSRASWQNRAHFGSVAAHLMRRILVQHARIHNAEKRGGKLEKLYLDETRELSSERPPELLVLEEALQGFAASYPREAQVVELKFFGGLRANEIAEVLNVSAKAVSRDWHFAKLWLRRELKGSAAHA